MNKECIVLVGTIDGKKQMREFDGQEIVVLDCKFPIRLDKNQSLSELNDLAQEIMDMHQVYVDHLQELIDYFGCSVYGLDNIVWEPNVNDDQDLGDYVLEENFLPIPSALCMYIDCQFLGRDVRYNSHLLYTSDGMFYRTLRMPSGF